MGILLTKTYTKNKSPLGYLFGNNTLERKIWMLFGYARCSTQSQNLDRQIDMLSDSDQIFSEHFTGTKANRPEWDRLKSMLRAGDTLKIESLSRLGRSMKDLMQTISFLQEHGVNLISCKENIDLSTPTGRLCLNILSSLAEFERDTIAQRTQEGLASARSRGRCGGRPKKNPRDVDRAIRMYEAKSHSLKEIKDLTGIPATTLYRYAKRDQ